MKISKLWNILLAIAIAENTIVMIIQGGIWILLGVLFGGFWLLLCYWERQKKRQVEVQHLISLAQVLEFEIFSRRLSEAGVTVEEFGQAISSISTEGKAFVGDIRCVNNARNSYLRCAVNPCGRVRAASITRWIEMSNHITCPRCQRASYIFTKNQYCEHCNEYFDLSVDSTSDRDTGAIALFALRYCMKRKSSPSLAVGWVKRHWCDLLENDRDNIVDAVKKFANPRKNVVDKTWLDFREWLLIQVYHARKISLSKLAYELGITLEETVIMLQQNGVETNLGVSSIEELNEDIKNA